MKDSAVDPVGLFDPRRQKRLLDGLAHRCRSCVQEQAKLLQRHNTERSQEEQNLAASRDETTDECRQQRRDMLEEWDEAEEKLTASYEATALKTREKINRLGSIFRKKLSEGAADIKRKVEARREAVQHQYDARKNQPIEQRAKEVEQIDTSLMAMTDDIEWARALTIRRLDRLPEVGPPSSPEENMREVPPKSVQEAIDTIYRLNRKCKKTVAEMQTGAASKIVDSFYLPAGVAIFIVIWAVLALAFGPKPPWIAMAAGVPVAGILGFSIYAILLWPLKKMTRRLYPQVERIREAAEECAQTGRDIARKTADDTSKELSDRRDAHLLAADRWKKEQHQSLEAKLNADQQEARQNLMDDLHNVNQQYLDDYTGISADMHERAETLAIHITDTLSQTDERLAARKKANAEARQQQFERLNLRLKQGVSGSVQRIKTCVDQVTSRFPSWESIGEGVSDSSKLDFLPIGSLLIGDSLRESFSTKSLGDQGDSSAVAEIMNSAEVSETLPVVLHRRLHSGVMISAAPNQMDKAIEVCHQILWRLLTGVAPSKAKLTLIDPLGRGQNFTSFMALADHDPALVGHRVWTSDANVESRLMEIGQHVEDVLQTTLRDQFQRIEDYNEVAGSMSEPYRIVAGVGFPEGLSRSSHRHLLALIESGLRCGVFTIMVVDQTKAWPTDMPMPHSEKLLRLSVDENENWRLISGELDSVPFKPCESPPTAIRSEMIKEIGVAAVEASKVEIPLPSILDRDEEGQGSTDDGIRIVIGSQGANRNLALDLGEGVKQHVLIAGKTGSGKSTLLHSIIISGAYHYRPDQLHYYLLDFKKGVEFKPYADHHMPHARVIGIESEREFGRSVLQRLDAELQERGEKFRGYGVQDIADYRGQRGDEMPRIMLVVDEFQELFVRDDRLAADCAMLLDRLVRQGRSFGIHIVLSSQSLAGAYSLPRATLGQMAVRIAMQCSESDAALILSDENTAARLLTRPGEAIYNNAGGLIEGNQPFQVAWLSNEDHEKLIQRVVTRDDKFADHYSPPVIFEGNRPCGWSGPLADAAIQGETETTALRGLLGEAVEIGPPATLELPRNGGRNVLMIVPPDARAGILGSTLSTFCRSHPTTKIVYFDGTRVDDAPSMMPWLEESGLNAKQVKLRECEKVMAQIAGIVKDRDPEQENLEPVVLVIDPLDRFREFRNEESFDFSLDSAANAVNGATSLRDVLRDGPNVNVFVFLICNSAETLSRWLPRSSHHDLELRLLGRMNPADSSKLIDTPAAAELSAATILMYDESDGRITKFRQCDLPEGESVRRWLGR